MWLPCALDLCVLRVLTVDYSLLKLLSCGCGVLAEIVCGRQLFYVNLV